MEVQLCLMAWETGTAYWYYIEKNEEYNAWLKEYHENLSVCQVGSVSSGANDDDNRQRTAAAVDGGGAIATFSQADAVHGMALNASMTIATSGGNDTSMTMMASTDVPPTSASIDIVFINAGPHIDLSSGPHADAATFTSVPISKHRHPLDKSSINIMAATDGTAIPVLKRAQKVRSDKGVKRGSRKAYAQSAQIENVMPAAVNAEP
ncbi:uncharacterized protein LAESUDRAFT_712515 [Laetiporus sulphureus 93-53]|uniref:Uncharacterized protein n=1 Tax=Laetiporus sulphureus 93-53 TaxID=1314785 RepID=A0A165FFK3_9APHY|nr:uncharacterized protein LAESUDRAFT_712515 [Laetiporus sulphureus 93-53]KZT08896.1 hypothetical protein LAESUDRAFT_712515 [Laetiporus sulphureus 93-53]